MSAERTIGRYRRWYARLLRLYPRPYHDRFGEPMSQTFADLARERTDANRSLMGFVIATFAETAIQIVRENAMHRRPGIRHYLRWVLFTGAVLLVPLLAMVLRVGVADPGSRGVESVNWGPMDFAAAGVLILGAGLLYEYASGRSAGVAHRAAVGIAVGAGLLLVWANLAVGLIGRDGHPANLLYLLVLGVALGGALMSRFAPAGLSVAMFATASVQTVIAGFAVATGLPATPVADLFFATAWLASALLFRRASVVSPSAA